MKPVLTHLGLVSALGSGCDATWNSLMTGKAPGMGPVSDLLPGKTLTVGRVLEALPSLEGFDLRHRSRNNALLLHAANQIRAEVERLKAKHGAGRVALVLGTSTSGVGEAERAFMAAGEGGTLPAGFHYGQMETGSPTVFLAEALGIQGPAFTLSTACSSSAKALASAARLMDSGVCEAAVAGGGDMLCAFTVAGFSALEAISPEPCNPLSRNRHGINIGEAAALFTLEREGAGPRLGGWGESSDAYNISAPEPEGKGAEAAMLQALAMAGLKPGQIDYLNLHGTSTEHNDSMESRAVSRVLGSSVPCSSTKPFSGHTLGAAGALEAALCWLTLSPSNAGGLLPPHLFDGDYDDKLPSLRLVARGESLGRPVRHAMSNSFGFGGSNASLVLSCP